MITFEIIHTLKRRTVGNNAQLALKIDISKAYDRVDWGFLRGVLQKMGFAETWIKWMMMCVTSVNYSVLVNADSVGPIQPGRGLQYRLQYSDKFSSISVKKVQGEQIISGVHQIQENVMFHDDVQPVASLELTRCDTSLDEFPGLPYVQTIPPKPPDFLLISKFTCYLLFPVSCVRSAERPPPKPPDMKVTFHLNPSDEEGRKPVVISSKLNATEEARLIQILQKNKAAIGWVLADLKGISPAYCMHKIMLEEDFKPVAQPQRRLNPTMKEVVRKEVIKLLEAGMIYPISDSAWVSPVQVVPKKGGMTVIRNDKNELIPSRTVTGWRMCIDYRRLNKATRKDHFPLPFMDQMLERLSGQNYYCFLDGYSGYNQIVVNPEDHEKTAFTCPFGIFAYRRMPFGLCNAPTTFQRCMQAIFSDLIEKSIEVFMDDFSVFGKTFDTCLNNLDVALERCIETNLILNWEKCHFMVTEGIVLGHKVSSRGLEVDQAKVEVISKLPPPINVKGVRSFLGHAGFYRRFVKDFS
ncbi:uncharacterized protein LOC131651432, partial [Vicia villosa]|uniref:uncharacterized protein LOC131651432 n=1 Tax=Vicia villosa TaxID=3911 RepID=UPI00273CB693